ncbi:MAG TPA: GNAT family N-acetyltransferase [Aquihabitans sp.]|nr:GNAT family N-acetyltransferase [Aquihabitans sp.]
MDVLPEGTEVDDLVLRAWAPADAPALHAAVTASVEHLRPWMPWIRFEPMAVEQRVELIEHWVQRRQDGGDLAMGVWRDGVVVGAMGLHRRLGPDALELGYWVHVDHAGRGVATAAARAATDLAFTVAGIEHVEIHHDIANVASSRVPEKLGYERIGTIEPNRPHVAPSETGTDVVWRTSRPAWTAA